MDNEKKEGRKRLIKILWKFRVTDGWSMIADSLIEYVIDIDLVGLMCSTESMIHDFFSFEWTNSWFNVFPKKRKKDWFHEIKSQKIDTRSVS